MEKVLVKIMMVDYLILAFCALTIIWQISFRYKALENTGFYAWDYSVPYKIPIVIHAIVIIVVNVGNIFFDTSQEVMIVYLLTLVNIWGHIAMHDAARDHIREVKWAKESEEFRKIMQLNIGGGRGKFRVI